MDVDRDFSEQADQENHLDEVYNIITETLTITELSAKGKPGSAKPKHLKGKLTYWFKAL